MKLWKFSYWDGNSPSGRVSEWFLVKRAAVRAEQQRRKEGREAYQSFGIEQVEIPIRSRAAMAEWLTRYQP